MLTQQQLLDLGLAPDKDSLRKHLTRAAHELGFGLFSVALIRGDMESGRAWIEVVSNPPAAYVDAANSLSDALRDPVMTALRRSVQPVLYDQSTYTGAGVADLWDMQAPFGYRFGVACADHASSHIESFMLGFDRYDALPTDLVGRIRMTAAVQMVAAHAQAALQRLCTPKPSGSPLALINDGELEVLRWTKDADTVSMIGDKLVISTREVQRRQRSAARKLGASTVQGAVLRCIQGGLID